jgi:hypothetical protein
MTIVHDQPAIAHRSSRFAGLRADSQVTVAQREAAIAELIAWYDAAPADYTCRTFARVAEEILFTASGTDLLPSALGEYECNPQALAERYPYDPETGTTISEDLHERVHQWEDSCPKIPSDVLEAVRASLKPTRAFCGDCLRISDNHKPDCPHCASGSCPATWRLSACSKCAWTEKPAGPDFGSRTQILEDTENRFSGAVDVERFAREYAAKLPLGWQDGVVLFLEIGEPIFVVRWTPDRVPFDGIQKWAGRRYCTDDGYTEDSPRWKPHDSIAFNSPHVLSVAIPPTVAPARTLHELAAEAPSAANEVTPIAIPSLNAVLAIGGVPRGARVVIQGPTGNCKTTLALEVAAGYAAAGQTVVWIATRDEPPQSICARILQREQGMTQDDALRALVTAVHFGGKFVIIDGREISLEDILALEDEFILFVDTLQKARTRAGADVGRLESIAAALEVIESSGRTVWMTSALTRAGQRGDPMSASFGGAFVENGATLMIDARRDGDTLTLEVLKSRYGGEGQKVELRVDRARQRVLAGAGAADDVETRIRADLLREAATEPRSKRQLAKDVQGTAVIVRRVRDAMIDAGQLTVDDAGLVRAPS